MSIMCIILTPWNWFYIISRNALFCLYLHSCNTQALRTLLLFYLHICNTQALRTLLLSCIHLFGQLNLKVVNDCCLLRLPFQPAPNADASIWETKVFVLSRQFIFYTLNLWPCVLPVCMCVWVGRVWSPITPLKFLKDLMALAKFLSYSHVFFIIICFLYNEIAGRTNTHTTSHEGLVIVF